MKVKSVKVCEICDPFFNTGKAKLRDSILKYVCSYPKESLFQDAINILALHTDEEILTLFESLEDLDSDILPSFKKYMLLPEKTKQGVRTTVLIDFMHLNSLYGGYLTNEA